MSIDNFKKIPCPNCANKIIAMVDGVDTGKQLYKCRVCRAFVTYSHLENKILSVKTYTRK